MKRSEQLAIGAILLSSGVIFVPTKAEPLLLSEAGYQSRQKQHTSWQSTSSNMWFQTEQWCGNGYLNPVLVVTEKATGLLWHRFSLVTPPVIAYWLMVARCFKCCWERFNAGA